MKQPKTESIWTRFLRVLASFASDQGRDERQWRYAQSSVVGELLMLISSESAKRNVKLAVTTIFRLFIK